MKINELLKALGNAEVEDLMKALATMNGNEAPEQEAPTKEEQKKEAPKKGRGRKKKEEAPMPEPEEEETEEEETDGTTDYSSMSAKELYAECCSRGISSKCKDRKKATLIALLQEHDAGKTDEDDSDDWDDDEEEETEVDPYAGKSAQALYKMCVDRGIKVPKKKTEAFYKAELKKADEKENTKAEESEDDDDDWEI